MVLSEPKQWTDARRARMQGQYPQLAVGSPDDILNVDAYNLAQRMQTSPVSPFSVDAMRLAAYAGQQTKKPDTQV